MKILEKVKNFIVKLRALPESKKKIIFFTVIVICALFLLFWEIKLTQKNIAKISQSAKSVQLPSIDFSGYNPDDRGIDFGNTNIGALLEDVSESGQEIFQEKSEDNQDQSLEIYQQ